MRTRIRLLALAVVATGGGILASPRAAHATYSPPPPTLYCCCEVSNGACVTRCCSTRGCTVTGNGCLTTPTTRM
jgi:hypothetical protein